jgi:hypothetical protein
MCLAVAGTCPPVVDGDDIKPAGLSRSVGVLPEIRICFLPSPRL